MRVELPMPRLVRRRTRSTAMAALSPLVALAATVVFGGLLFLAMGRDPGAALYHYFVAPFTTRFGVTELAVKASPLLLCGLGLALAFRANVWNIGAEGQLVMGAIGGGGLALAFYGADAGWWLLPAMLAAGTLAGMAWAAIPAFLKLRFNANEILTSLMLTYVALLALSALVHGPWRDPEGFNFPESRVFEEAATVPVVVAGSRLHLGVLVALALVPVAWAFLARTRMGFGLTVTGLAPRAARYAGFGQDRAVWIAMLASGGMAGLAGVIEAAGPVGQLVPQLSPGYGFTAIIVAFLGRLHPAGVLLASIVLALSFIGGETAQIAVGLPTAVTGVFQGMLLFFLLGADVLIRYRVRFRAARSAA